MAVTFPTTLEDPMYRLLRDPRFGLLTLGHALNGIGSWTSLIAVWGYAAYQFELGPAHLSLLVLAWGLPPVLLGPAAGLLIDRIGPRPVAVTADLANAAVALAMIASADLATLLALTVLHGIGKAFAAPAYAALLPRAVPPDRLFDANAVFTAAADLAMVLGPVVAAGVIATAGTAAAFAVDAVTYLIGAAATLPLSLHPVPAARHEPSSGTWAQLHAGLRAVRTSTGTKMLFTLGFSLWLSLWNVPGAGARVRPRRPQPAGDDLRAPADRFRCGTRRHRNGTVEPAAVPGEHLPHGSGHLRRRRGSGDLCRHTGAGRDIRRISCLGGLCRLVLRAEPHTAAAADPGRGPRPRPGCLAGGQQPRSTPARAGVSRPRRHRHAGQPYRVRRPPGGRRARRMGRLPAKPGSPER